MPRINLFYAALPSASARPLIETVSGRVQRGHRLQGSRITGHRLHCTLAAIDEPGRSLRDIIERAKAVGDRIKRPPFSVCFERTGSFDVHRDRYPLVLQGGGGLKPLVDFRQAIGMEMMRAGLSVTSSYTPHVTLLWADRPVADYPIAPITWTVTDFVLVASVAGETRHIHVARWPLQ